LGVLAGLVAFAALVAVEFVSISLTLQRRKKEPFFASGEPQAGETVRDIFVAVLDRMPTAAEKSAFVRAMTRGGMTERQVTEHLRRHPPHSEFAAAPYDDDAGGFDDPEDGRRAFAAVLRRPPYVPFLEKDEESRRDVRRVPDQHVVRVVVQVYARLLDRLPTEAEVLDHYYALRLRDPRGDESALRRVETAVRDMPEYKRLRRVSYDHKPGGRGVGDPLRRDALILEVWNQVHARNSATAAYPPPPFEWHVLRALLDDLSGDVEAFREALRAIRDRREKLEVAGKPPLFFREDETSLQLAPYDASPSALYDENAQKKAEEGRGEDWGKTTWTRDIEARLCSRQACGPTW